jgi:hypothetical protein
VCPPRNNHQAVQTHEPGPRQTPLARRSASESFLTVKSSSHLREFRFTRFGCQSYLALSAARDNLSRASLHEPHISSAARQCRRVVADAANACAFVGASNKPIERLGPVSSAPYGAYTSGLSTWWSTTALKGYLVSREASRLDAFSGYPVRT